MSTWRLAKAIITLQAEVNHAYPDRPKSADGTIGDRTHAQRQSDHNPDPPHAGVVTAWDITTAPFTDALAEQFRVMGAHGDGRVKYVIYKHRFTSDQHGWKWVDYDGPNGVNPGGDPHTNHIHLSTGLHDSEAQYDRTDPWNVFTQEDELTANDLKQIDALIKKHVDAAVAQLHQEHVLILHGNATDGHVNSIDSIAKQVGVPQK